ASYSGPIAVCERMGVRMERSRLRQIKYRPSSASQKEDEGRRVEGKTLPDRGSATSCDDERSAVEDNYTQTGQLLSIATPQLGFFFSRAGWVLTTAPDLREPK